MKKNIICIILSVLMLISVFPSNAWGEQYDTYTFGDYEISVAQGETVASIKYYKGAEKDLVIPEELGGYKITGIDVHCFYNNENNKNICSVTVPSSVTAISNYAFSGCTSLSTIILPSTLTSIGKSVFTDTAFYNNEANWQNGFLYIGNYLIESRIKTFDRLEIKAGTRLIAPDAFYGCSISELVYPEGIIIKGLFETKVTTMIFPASATVIPPSTFGVTYGIKNLVFKEGTTTLGASSFSTCSMLETITWPKSLVKLEGRVFGAMNPELKKIIYNGTEEDWNKIDFGADNAYLKDANVEFAAVIPPETQPPVQTETAPPETTVVTTAETTTEETTTEETTEETSEESTSEITSEEETVNVPESTEATPESDISETDAQTTGSSDDPKSLKIPIIIAAAVSAVVIAAVIFIVWKKHGGKNAETTTEETQSQETEADSEAEEKAEETKEDK